MRPGRAAAVVAAGAVTVAAVTFGLTEAVATRDAARPGPGFGADPVADHRPRTRAWADAAGGGLTAGLEPTSPAACRAGEPACLDAVITEMAARLADLGCAHTAPFAFAYLDMTRGVDERLAGGFFDNPPAVAHFDALFADVYFDAFDNAAAGRQGHVPPVWRLAFTAAEKRAASAPADLLLGMTAHISRDLAYTVARVRHADVGYRREDFFAVDDIIASVRQPMLDEAGRRFDPAIATIEDTLLARGADVGAVGLISLWRGEALELGNRLAAAADEQARAAITAEIERRSIATAALILNLDATRSLGLAPEPRRAHCEQARS